MRDKRKTLSYFETYLKTENERILKQEEKVKSCTDWAKLDRINSSLLLYRMNALIASFSCGKDRVELTHQLQRTCETALCVDKLTYADALVLSSLAVMLNSYDGIKPVVTRFDSVFSKDKLLRGIAKFITSGEAEWRGDYTFPGIYSDLDAVIDGASAEDRERALLDHLQGWYANCSDSAWYGTLDNPYDVYYGYWSFESAALARIFGLDIKKLSTNEFYPAL